MLGRFKVAAASSNPALDAVGESEGIAATAYVPDFWLRINGHDVPAAIRSCITSVRYEDGRTGTYSADLKIRDAKTFPPAAAKRAA